jgi:Na+/phosphate symporter
MCRASLLIEAFGVRDMGDGLRGAMGEKLRKITFKN